MSETPAPKSKWIHADAQNRRSTPPAIRVMGTVEGWVVARLKGAAPFLVHVNEWHRRFVPLESWAPKELVPVDLPVLRRPPPHPTA